MEEITKDNFESVVLNSDIPALVDFWAEWCGPCISIDPIFEKVAGDLEGKVIFGKVNVDKEKELSSRCEISGIPCMIFFKDGKEAGRITGFRSEVQLKAAIDELM